MSVGFIPAAGFTAGFAASEIPFWDGYSTFANGVISGAAQGPLFSPNPWDVVIINNKRLPGIGKAHGEPTLGIDKKGSKGRDGAVFSVNGYVPGPIQIESTIWTPEQWSEWQKIVPFIWRRPNAGSVKGAALAVSISYPSLQHAGINRVVIVGFSPAQPGSFRGSMVIRLKALEFVPPGAVNNAIVKPKPNDVPIAQRYQRKNAPPPPSAGGNGLTGPRPSTQGGSD